MSGFSRILLSALLLMTLVGRDMSASAVTAASCSAGDVQAALNRAAAGDTVFIPAGTCRWSSGVVWSAPPNVTVLGAGNLSVRGGGDATVIVDDYASDGALLEIATSATGTFRLAGLTFQGGSSGSAVKWGGVVRITGQSHQARLDHLHFNMKTYSPSNQSTPLRFFGWVYGVVDNVIVDLSGIGNGIRFAHDGYNNDTSGSGDAAWAGPTNFGSHEFIFVEDSTFNSETNFGAVNDCNAGGRYVFRYNTVISAGLQTHPTGGAGRGRGCRASEIYGNTFLPYSSTQEPPFNAYFLSSGPALLWGNTVNANAVKNFVTLHSMRRSNGTYSQGATPNGWGYCGDSMSGAGSNWDGNTNASTGYPCLDQPGRGQGDLLSGMFPSVTNATRGCTSSSPCWPRQALEPVREWLNAFAPSNGWGGTFWSVYNGDVLAENRDYYLYTTSFGGTSGNGAGPRSSRPAACTPGVAYWSTDQGTLDVCAAPNTWSNNAYTPYSYPHPLTQGTSSSAPPPPSGPLPPTNVRITS